MCEYCVYCVTLDYIYDYNIWREIKNKNCGQKEITSSAERFGDT